MTAAPEAVFTVYGLVFTSPYQFHIPLHTTTAKPEFYFNFCDHPLWQEAEWLVAAPLIPLAGIEQEGIDIRQHGDTHLFRLLDLADYRVSPREIQAYVYNSDDLIFAEKEFFDTVLPLYLELQGYFVLHASAVVIEGRAYAFTAYSGRGKSSLAAGLVKRGFRFVADDRVVIDRSAGNYHVLPGYPLMRLWPDAAVQFIDVEAYPVMHPDWRKHLISLESWATAETEASPLAGIYLVDCQEAYQGASFTRLHGHAGMFKLIHSSAIFSALVGLQAQRMQTISTLLQYLPVKIFSYPAGYDHLNESLDALLADIRAW